MSKNKIGRNDKCHCGSGKKYKNCCIDNGEDIANNYFSSYDKIDLLKINGALQLLSTNHGKNIRFELIGKEILKSSTKNEKKIPYKDLSDYYEHNFADHYLEDPVSSCFTENAIWFFGNYTIFPGLNHNGSAILNCFLTAIFARPNSLPEVYINLIHDAITLLLSISHKIASRAGLNRYNYGNSDLGAISIPTNLELDKLKTIVTFSLQDLQDLENLYRIDSRCIVNFIVDEKEAAIFSDNPDDNPLLTKPIYKNGDDEYIVCLPTTLVNSMLYFIKEQAKSQGIYIDLLECYYNYQWTLTIQHLNSIGWRHLNIDLPPTELNTNEAIFQFDNDKLAYVTFIPAGSNKKGNNGELPNIGKEIELHESRTREVLDFVKGDDVERNDTFFLLTIIGECGEDGAFLYRRPEAGTQALQLLYGELKPLVFSGKLDELTLWKFSKVYNRAQAKTRILNFGGILDAFVGYFNNHEAILPQDEEIPTVLNIAVGDSFNFERESVIRRDEHAILRTIEGIGLIPIPVIRMRDFAPIYKEREPSFEHNLALEAFDRPIWLLNNQSKKRSDKEIVNIYSEAIAFWLYRMQEVLKECLNTDTIDVIEIELILAPAFFEQQQIVNITKENAEEINFKIELEDSKINISIPDSLQVEFFRPDNLGEKHLMKAVLDGINIYLVSKQLNPIDEVDKIIENILQPSSAKMILYFDSNKDLRIDTRWLGPYREIQESEISIILEDLVSYLNLTEPIPPEIDKVEDKNKLSHKIVSTLIAKLNEELAPYNSSELLLWLMKCYEKCIQKREFVEIDTPAKISCFSSFPVEVEKLKAESQKLVETSIALRCVIEFIAASPSFGSKWPNFDDSDRLLALMHEIVSWGIFSDSIDLGMDNPKMGLLPSGRIGTEKTFSELYMKPFAQARTESVVDQFQEGFAEKLADKVTIEAEYTEEVKTIDEAFLEEYGISFTDILKLYSALARIVIDEEKSVIEMSVSKTTANLKIHLPDLEEKTIILGLDLLTLNKRDNFNKSPVGFEKDDIYPWRYNRALSYLRRPIVKITDLTNEVLLYWGFRHVLDSAENLKYLLFSGRLKCQDGGKLAQYIASINNEKGKDFRNMVANWLMAEGTLRIIPHEITFDKLSNNIDDRKLGDIDIMAIDDQNKIIYSIECKNTVPARIMHEMKSEMDKYLGRDEDKAWVHKHAKRNDWLKENKTLLKNYVTNPEEYIIVSLIVTSNDIPLIYLKIKESPLPIVSFPSIRRNGLQLQQELIQ